MTNRPVYDRAYSGWGIQHILYQLEREDFYREITPPEYIIYVIIKKNDVLILNKPKYGIVQTSSVYTAFYNYYVDKIVATDKNIDQNFDLMKMHFVASKKLVDKRYPRTKFVILKYLERTPNDKYLNSKRWKELEDKGFIVIDTLTLTGQDLSKRKYKLADGHPNEKAWDLVVPKLLKELNL